MKNYPLFPLAYEAREVGSGALQDPPQRRYPARFTDERPMRVLFLGQMNFRKGVARLLEAAQILRDEPVEFWMVGPVRSQMLRQSRQTIALKWFGPATRKRGS